MSKEACLNPSKLQRNKLFLQQIEYDVTTRCCRETYVNTAELRDDKVEALMLSKCQNNERCVHTVFMCHFLRLVGKT